MQHVSVYYHDKKNYDCPDCGKPMERAHVHGWFWACENCKKDFPLYVLKEKTEEPVAAEPPKKSLMDKIKGALHV